MGSRNYDEGSDWELVLEMIEVMLWKAPTHLFSRLLRIGRSSNCMNHLKDWMEDMRLKAASEARCGRTELDYVGFAGWHIKYDQQGVAHHGKDPDQFPMTS